LSLNVTELAETPDNTVFDIDLNDNSLSIEDFSDSQDLEDLKIAEINNFDNGDTHYQNTSENNIKEIEFKPIDYSLFNFVPKENNEQLNEENIQNKLRDLNNIKPELNILRIFDLKYKQNLPISKIAEELNTDTQTIVSALDEIVELI
jgi:hypothetical protein